MGHLHYVSQAKGTLRKGACHRATASLTVFTRQPYPRSHPCKAHSSSTEMETSKGAFIPSGGKQERGSSSRCKYHIKYRLHSKPICKTFSLAFRSRQKAGGTFPFALNFHTVNCHSLLRRVHGAIRKHLTKRQTHLSDPTVHCQDLPTGAHGHNDHCVRFSDLRGGCFYHRKDCKRQQETGKTPRRSPWYTAPQRPLLRTDERGKLH